MFYLFLYLSFCFPPILCALILTQILIIEMVETMKKVAKLDVELTAEERNLVSVGYKNVIGARRASWWILSSIEQKEEAKGNEQNVKRIKDCRQRVEDELSKICNDILSVIYSHLIPSSTTGKSTVFYYKMWVTKDLLFCCFHVVGFCLLNHSDKTEFILRLKSSNLRERFKIFIYKHGFGLHFKAFL